MHLLLLCLISLILLDHLCQVALLLLKFPYLFLLVLNGVHLTFLDALQELLVEWVALLREDFDGVVDDCGAGVFTLGCIRGVVEGSSSIV